MAITTSQAIGQCPGREPGISRQRIEISRQKQIDFSIKVEVLLSMEISRAKADGVRACSIGWGIMWVPRRAATMGQAETNTSHRLYNTTT